jgi:hypothetical protein
MKIDIKTLLIVFLSFVFIQLSADNFVELEGVQYPIKHYKMTKILEETFNRGDKLYLSGDGIIKIKFWDKDMIRVECIKTIEYAHMDISEIGIGDIIVKVKRKNRTIKINTEFLYNKLPFNKEISHIPNEYINVYMPKLTNVEVDNNKGSGIEYNLDTIGRNKLVLKSVDGIECYLDTIGDNKIILKSGKSNITLRINSKINDIYAKTKGGNIKSFYKINSTIDKKNARIVLETKSGDINIEKLNNQANEK